jgi:hypothetical protein
MIGTEAGSSMYATIPKLDGADRDDPLTSMRSGCMAFSIRPPEVSSTISRILDRS